MLQWYKIAFSKISSFQNVFLHEKIFLNICSFLVKFFSLINWLMISIMIDQSLVNYILWAESNPMMYLYVLWASNAMYILDGWEKIKGYFITHENCLKFKY